MGGLGSAGPRIEGLYSKVPVDPKVTDGLISGGGASEPAAESEFDLTT